MMSIVIDTDFVWQLLAWCDCNTAPLCCCGAQPIFLRVVLRSTSGMLVLPASWTEQLSALHLSVLSSLEWIV